MKHFEIAVEFYPVPEEAVLWAPLESASFDLLLSWTGDRLYGSAVVKARTEQNAFSDFQLLALVAGLTVKKVDLGLVSTSEIAEELGSSRETVRLWAEGKRRAGFPAPFAIVGGSNIWAWSEVYDWAKKQVGLKTPDFTPLSLSFVEKLNGKFAQGRAGLTENFAHLLHSFSSRDLQNQLTRHKSKAGFFEFDLIETAVDTNRVL